MLTDDEIESKYNIVFIGKQRHYKEDLSQKDYSLEFTTPVSLEINGKSFITSSWRQLIVDVCTEFLREQPAKADELLDYDSSWNNKCPFDVRQGKNRYDVGEGVYFISTQTALHACWLLRDVLEIFGVDLKRCKFIIHRPPSAEPSECRHFYQLKTESKFKYYYTTLLRHQEEKSDQVIRNIKKLNGVMEEVSKSYDNLLLIDNYYTYCTYKAKLIEYLRDERCVDEKTMSLVCKYLDILGDFYKTIK